MEHFGFQGIFLAGGDSKETERYPEEFEAALNFACLETNGKRILIDTGFGETGGQESGHLLHHLKQAGIKPDSIDYVILSHSHLDHTGGLLKTESPLFQTLFICSVKQNGCTQNKRRRLLSFTFSPLSGRF